MTEPALQIDLLAATVCVGGAENAFLESVDELEAFLRARPFGSDGSASQWARAHLITRSIADAKAGVSLVGNGFAVQMYSALRPILESLNLVELFARHPERADAWIAGEYRQFAPALVRSDLGLKGDELYAFMCAHSHPRLMGMQLSGFMRIDNGERSAVMSSGGLPLAFPTVMLAATMPLRLLERVALATYHWPSYDPEDDSSNQLTQRFVARHDVARKAIFELLHPDGIPDGSPAAQILEMHRDLAIDELDEDDAGG